MNSPNPSCQIITDVALSGQQNMDIDAQMLVQAVSGRATFRTYQWNAPTVSLGHFQVTSAQAVPERFAELDYVKRLSGGGAILHDREITYSLALPKWHPLTTNPSQIYNEVHDCLIEVFARFGVTSQMRGDAAFADKPFLCFGRGDERDIVIGSNKIVGSAQRRRQGAVLQHGSVLLEASPHAPEFPGIHELSGQTIPLDQFVPQFRELVLERLNLSAT